MSNRLAILAQIDEIYDNNCAICPHANKQDRSICKYCPAFTEIRGLGQEIANKETKVARILAKGDSMTFNEVDLLLDEGIKLVDIVAAIGMSYTGFYQLRKMREEALI